MKTVKKEYIVVFLVIIAIYIAGKRAGKKKGTTIKADYNTDEIGKNFSGEAMALKVANNFIGYQFWDNNRKETLNDLLRLTNGELGLTYNTFNEKYVKSPKTMTTVLKGDWIYNETDDIRDVVVARLQLMNLN